MAVLILTGPAGAGKNTIAAALARRLGRCAAIDVDLVRAMVLRPHRAPWEGEEGRAQHELGVRNACHLARSFAAAGFDVIVHDVLTDGTARLYDSELAGVAPAIVLLLPSFAEIERRNLARGPRLTADEIATLYAAQQALRRYDLKIDNTSLTPEAVSARLADYLRRPVTTYPD